MENFGNIYVHMYYDISRKVMGLKGLDAFSRPGDWLLGFIDQNLSALQIKNHEDLAVPEDLFNLHPYFRLLDHSILDQILNQSKYPVQDIEMGESQYSGIKNLHLDRLIQLQQIYYSILNLMNKHNPNHSKADYYKVVLDHDYIQAYRFYSQTRMTMLSVDDKIYPVEDCLLLGFEDCLFFELHKLVLLAGYIKICKNCGKFFIPKRSNVDYCHRIYTDDGRTCSDVGYTQTFAKSVKNDDVLQAYTRAYKAHYARMTKPRKKAPNMTREAFETWYEEAKRKLELVRSGQLDAESYKAWLKD